MQSSKNVSKLLVSRLLVLGVAVNLIHAISLLVDWLTENDANEAVFSWSDKGVIHWIVYWTCGAILFAGVALSRRMESIFGLGVLLASIFLMLAGNGGWFINESDFVTHRFATSILSVAFLAFAAIYADRNETSPQ